MATNDWLSIGFAGIFNIMNSITLYIMEPVNRVRMGFGEGMPDGEWLVKEVMPRVERFRTAFHAWENDSRRTRIDVIELNEAREELKPLLRELAKRLKNSLPVSVTDADLVAMGLPRRSEGRRKSAIVMKDFPACQVDTSLIRHLIIRFSTYVGNMFSRKGKPAGQHGVECRWVISDTPVSSTKELIQSTFCTRSPIDLEFDDDRGKTVYFALRWVNNRGITGNWSPILSAIIP